MRQQHLRNIGIVLNQISFGDSQLGPKQFIEIGELNRTAREPGFELLDAFGNLDAPVHGPGARRRGMFRRMIVAMGFGPSHLSHRFAQIGTDQKPKLFFVLSQFAFFLCASQSQNKTPRLF